MNLYGGVEKVRKTNSSALNWPRKCNSDGSQMLLSETIIYVVIQRAMLCCYVESYAFRK